jgi:hypothetical protein
MRTRERLDADHVGELAALNPHALPDRLSHAYCNQVVGAALSSSLRNITDPTERRRITAEVTERWHRRLRGQAPPRGRAAARVPATEPPLRRVSSW